MDDLDQPFAMMNDPDCTTVPLNLRKIDVAMVEMFLSKFADDKGRQVFWEALEITGQLPEVPQRSRKKRRP